MAMPADDAMAMAEDLKAEGVGLMIIEDGGAAGVYATRVSSGYPLQ